MPSLTHVCILSDHKWRGVTPFEAAEIFPDAIPAKSGIFMCALCHQYVYFSRSGAQVRHFGHTPEADKSCPERTQGANVYIDSYSGKHDLPIRLKLLPSEFPTDFELEIGLLGVPDAFLGDLRGATIQIVPVKLAAENHVRESFPDSLGFPAFALGVKGDSSPASLFKMLAGEQAIVAFQIKFQPPFVEPIDSPLCLFRRNQPVQYHFPAVLHIAAVAADHAV